MDLLGSTQARESISDLRQAKSGESRLEKLSWLRQPLMSRLLVPVLLEALRNADPRLRAKAAENLGLMVPECAKVVSGLLSVLDDPDPEVRVKAVSSLGLLESEAEAAIPALLHIVTQSKDGCVRRQSALALGRIGTRNPDAVMPALLEALRDKSARGGAIWGVIFLGPAAEGAVVPLVEIVRNPEGGDQDDAYDTRHFAMWALGSIGPKASAAVPMALEFLQNQKFADKRERSDAYLLLSDIGSGAEAAVPTLVKMVENGNPEDEGWSKAIHILGRIGQKAKAAVPVLMARVRDAKTSLRNRGMALNALEQIDPRAWAEVRMLLPPITPPS